MNKVAVALFDIDKTIISRDSMFALMRYAFKYHPSTRKSTLRFVRHGIKYALKQIGTKAVKEAAFACINELTTEELRLFYTKEISKYFYKDALEKIQELKKQGCVVLLITASPECYMKYFTELEGVDDVIGTILESRGDKFINIIQGKNCKGFEKVKRIEEWLGERQIEIDYEISYAFSDSMSDLPMFKLVKNAYLINNRKAQYPNKLYWN